MNKKKFKKSGETKHLIFLPLVALLMAIGNIAAVAQTTNKGNHKSASEVVEDEPKYPGGTVALIDYLNKNTHYPEAAKKSGIQGQVMTKYIVEKDGTISNVEIMSGLSLELDKEAIRVVSTMPTWNPGKQRGKHIFPIKFELPKDYKAEETTDTTSVGTLQTVSIAENETIEEPTDETQKIYGMVEQAPKYPGGIAAMEKYIAKSIKYPTDAKKAQIQGRVIVKIIIDMEGKVTFPEITHSLSPSLDAEAIRVISNMPQWSPGKQRGKAVRVQYQLPVVFQLGED